MSDLIRVAHGFKRESGHELKRDPLLDEIADTVENICEATGTTINVTGGTTYGDGTIELDCAGDQISQASANALARHFTQRIPIHEEDAGDVIVLNRSMWKR
jgi:hypothetical protein